MATAGRMGRLVLNLLLVRLGYPPAIIYKGQRATYLAALRRADRGDAGALGELIARAILENLYRFVVPAVAGPARLVPLAALATPELGANALRAAAVRATWKPRRAPTGNGAPPARGSSTTSAPDTGAVDNETQQALGPSITPLCG